MPLPAHKEQTRVAFPGSSFLAHLFKPSGGWVGLDVGSSSVKGVLMTRSGKGFKLLKAAVVPFPPGSDATKRSATIQQLIQQLNPQKTRVATALSGPGAVLRLINLPKMSAQELKASLDFEAEKYIPFKMKETYFDFSVIGDKADGRMELFLVAARRELVNAHMGLLDRAMVVPSVVDLEALALANAWEVSHPDLAEEDIVALIHVGARGTILDFLQGFQFQFTREIPLGGGIFTQAVAEGLHMEVHLAEALKRDPQEKAAEVQAILQPYWEEWLSQCRVSFDFYENQFGHHINRLFLSGGSARLFGFKEWIHQAARLPTEEWNPLAALTVGADRQVVESCQPALAVAVGLAVRELT